MPYIVPSVLVQQLLASSGGVATSTPNLEACIVGPAYNVLSYVPGSASSQIKTAAHSPTATTGSVLAASQSLTVVSTAGFNIGDSVLVSGAGVAGALLQTTILDIAGNVVTLAVAASTSVTGVAVVKPGALTNTLADSSFTLPGQVAGQVVDSASISPWLSNAVVETITTGARVSPNSNLASVTTATDFLSFTVNTEVGSNEFAAVPGLIQVGDVLIISQVGVAGVSITTKVLTVTSSLFTTDIPWSTVVADAACTKVAVSNINSLTNTLRAEAGDKVKFVYADNLAGHSVFTSTIQSVITTNGLNGSVLSFLLADTMPVSLVAAQVVSISVQKTYYDQQVPLINPLTSSANVDVSLAGSQGTFTLKAGISLGYGQVISGDVYASYRALRTDLSNRVLTFNNQTDLQGQLIELTEANPLGLASQVALANTAGRIRAVAITSDDSAGYLAALTTLQGERLYAIAPLTQDISVIAAYKTHAIQMSTPENAAWRIILANTAMSLTQTLGIAKTDGVSDLSNLEYVLTSPSATFLADGVAAGDVITFTAATATPSQVGTHTVLRVISNQQLVINTTAAANGISYFVSRSLSRTQMASAVASTSTTLGTSRVVHIQPDVVGVPVNGTTKFLPGYYLCAGVAGMVAGFAVQQGFTNIGIAGITDLQHSNFYFSKPDLNVMAGAGTMLFVQDTQGGLSYCRHELTTDMSVLNYRELLIVKEVDFLSYFYHDKLKAFIGSWNINKSSLNTVRQNLVASSELLKSQSLPKVGAVLLGYNIVSLQQDLVNTDHTTSTISVAVGTPMNYIDLSIVV